MKDTTERDEPRRGVARNHRQMTKRWPHFMAPTVCPAGDFRVGDFIWLADQIGQSVEVELGHMVIYHRPKAYKVTEARIEDGTAILSIIDADGSQRRVELWAIQDFHITKD